MHKFTIFMFCFVTGTLILGPSFASGLECYVCNTATEEKCKEGNLKDKYLRTCTPSNTIDPIIGLPINFTDPEQELISGCIKVEGNVKGEVTIKLCTTTIKGMSDFCGTGDYKGTPATVCVCPDDKCNAAATNFPTILALVLMLCSSLIFG